MWGEICKMYIPFDCYLLDIKGNQINQGTKVTDDIGFQYEFKWDGEHQEWVAVSLRENNKEYPMYQERVLKNKFIICN